MERQTENKRKLRRNTPSNFKPNLPAEQKANTGRVMLPGMCHVIPYEGRYTRGPKCNFNHQGATVPPVGKDQVHQGIGSGVQPGLMQWESQGKNPDTTTIWHGPPYIDHGYNVELVPRWPFLTVAKKIIRIPFGEDLPPTQGQVEFNIVIVHGAAHVEKGHLIDWQPSDNCKVNWRAPECLSHKSTMAMVYHPIDGSRKKDNLHERASEDNIGVCCKKRNVEVVCKIFQHVRILASQSTGPGHGLAAVIIRRFIEGFLKDCLTNDEALSKRRSSLSGVDKHEAAFQLMKKKLCSAPPILALHEGSEILSYSAMLQRRVSLGACVDAKRIKVVVCRDRQKSYADLKRKPMEFEVGDKVMLKVSPWKGVVRFGKRGKLNPRSRWNSKRGPEFTWEREDQFKKKYPTPLHQTCTVVKCCVISLEDKAHLTGGTITPHILGHCRTL
ncbi:hypothetical protein Tco_0568850 [Tanacetum coccineum]